MHLFKLYDIILVISKHYLYVSSLNFLKQLLIVQPLLLHLKATAGHSRVLTSAQPPLWKLTKKNIYTELSAIGVWPIIANMVSDL